MFRFPKQIVAGPDDGWGQKEPSVVCLVFLITFFINLFFYVYNKIGYAGQEAEDYCISGHGMGWEKGEKRVAGGRRDEERTSKR